MRWCVVAGRLAKQERVVAGETIGRNAGRGEEDIKDNGQSKGGMGRREKRKL